MSGANDSGWALAVQNIALTLMVACYVLAVLAWLVVLPTVGLLFVFGVIS